MATLTDIKVDIPTIQGVVVLSGKAPTKDASDLAAMLAKDTEGRHGRSPTRSSSLNKSFFRSKERPGPNRGAHIKNRSTQGRTSTSNDHALAVLPQDIDVGFARWASGSSMLSG